MPEPATHVDEQAGTAPRDRMLRRLIVIFIFAAVATFWTAVGVSAWHGPSHRMELVQQHAPLVPAAP